MAPPCQIPHTETSSYLRNLAVPRVFERPSYVTRWRRTGWLGRQDSNLRMSRFRLFPICLTYRKDFAETRPNRIT